MASGYLNVELTGAGIVDTINRAMQKGIFIYDARWIDALSVRFRVQISEYYRLQKLAAKQGDDLKIYGRRGVYFWIQSALRRPILLVCLFLLAVLSLWLPGRVLFIAVEGNEVLTTQQVLCQAEKSGVYFGAKRSVVRSEVVKNRLLEALPQLKWAGINTVGCTALISVREDPTKIIKESNYRASSIIADRDGVVLSVTTTSGTPLCKVGDVVKSGQILVSGRADQGLLFRYTRSDAEIYAQTVRECDVLVPVQYDEKIGAGEVTRCYSLVLGKKRINLSKGSGIYYTGYDKIYKEYCLFLPGGFQLPIALAVEEYRQYQQHPVILSDLESTVVHSADRYVLEQMISGRIISSAFSACRQDGGYELCAKYLCIEMIGRECNEELFIDGEDNGTNRER